jgi:hypothetical protein
MLSRMKFEIDSFVEHCLDQFPEDVWTSTSTTFFDPAIGGGQFVRAIERRLRACGHSDLNIRKRVFGFEDNLLKVKSSVNKHKLAGQYAVKPYNKFFEMDKIMQDMIITGNPPYNDGSEARTPIYDQFLEKLSKNNPQFVTFIIPSNWFSQSHNKLGKDVRNYLRKLGVYKIQINPVDLFEGVTVGTCTVFCKREYSGKIVLLNADESQSFEIDNFDNQIIPEFDIVSRNLLLRLKPTTPFVTYGGGNFDTSKWRIMTSYRKERFDLEPLNPLKVFEPEYESQSGYRAFASFDSKQEAEDNLENYKSFWHSKIVKFIMRKTRTSTTLDNPQLFWVPKIDINKVFTDQDLYTLFELTDEEIKRVEDGNM